MAFEHIKELVRNVPILKPLDYKSDEPIWLITDACSTGIGAVLSQGPDWKTARPSAFESRAYRGDENYGEWRYLTHDQELLAIVNALEKWQHLLLGTHFTICTDHESIKYLMTKSSLSGREARWCQFLARFDFDILYVPGRHNAAADALSRYPYVLGLSMPRGKMALNTS